MPSFIYKGQTPAEFQAANETDITALEPAVQTFDSSGTWNRPASGSRVLVECWGGGGGGGLHGSSLLIFYWAQRVLAERMRRG